VGEVGKRQKGDEKHERGKKNRRPLLHAGRQAAVFLIPSPSRVRRPPPTRSRLPHSPARTRFLYVVAPRLGMQNLTARGEPGAGEAERVLLLPQRGARWRGKQGAHRSSGARAARSAALHPRIPKSASDEEPRRTLQQGQSRSILSSSAFTWYSATETHRRHGSRSRLPRIATGFGASMFVFVTSPSFSPGKTKHLDQKRRRRRQETCRASSSMGLNRSEQPVERSRKGRPIRRDTRTLTTTTAAATSRPDEAGTRGPRRRRRRPPFVACCAISSSSSSAWTCSVRR